MKGKLKFWSIRLISFGLLSFLTIVLAVLNPSVLYANQTKFGNYTIYHHTDLAPEFGKRLTAIHAMAMESELYDASLEVKICLNDGSIYPAILEKLRGPAFGWGYLNIATFSGIADFEKNTVELNGYKWNLEQLFVHEITHCLQINALGVMNSNPVGSHPQWKWEGYPEYVSRKNETQLSLFDNIKRIELAKEEDPKEWGVFFADGTVLPRNYYAHWLLIQYCLDIKGMSYIELLNSELIKTTLKEEMNDWYLTML